MKSSDSMTQKETIDLLNKCWMTHDGMWFFHCLQEFGIEATNKMNKAAIKSLSAIEIKRIQQSLGCEKPIKNFEEFRAFFMEASTLMIPDFMNIRFNFPEENKMKWRFDRGKCFAHEGVNRLGVIDRYECGVLYRIQCWLEAFKIDHRFSPGIDKCLMHLNGDCSGTVEFTL